MEQTRSRCGSEVDKVWCHIGWYFHHFTEFKNTRPTCLEVNIIRPVCSTQSNVFMFWMCVKLLVTPQCYCASATLLRERMRTYGRRLIKSPNANSYFSGDKICVAPAADFRCDWAVSAMRPNSYTASVTNCSVTSVPCVSVGSLLHAITVALLSPWRGPLRHAASHSFLCRPLQSSFPVPCSAASRPAILVLLLLSCSFFSARWNAS